jgi:hypothetical protein
MLLQNLLNVLVQIENKMGLKNTLNLHGNAPAEIYLQNLA